MEQEIIQELYDDLDLFLETHDDIHIDINKHDDDYFDTGLHCSGIGSCIRKEVLSYANYPARPNNLQTKLTFMRGNFYHELVYLWLEWSDKYEIINKELNVTDNLPKPYKGKFDVSFKAVNHNISILADIKTANSNMFKKYSSTLPKPEHIKQLSAYATAYKFWDKLMMMYFSSGADHPQFYFVDKDTNIDRDMNTYIVAVNLYELNHSLPGEIDETFYPKEVWQCSYCNFKDISCNGYRKA